MKKGSIFKAVSMFAAVSILTIGMSVTAFAEDLRVALDFKAPDGSAVATEVIDGKTVYIVPHGSTFTVTETNGITLQSTFEVDFKNLPCLFREPGDLLVGVTYNVDNELYDNSLVGVGESFVGLNEGTYTANNMPEYSYILMTIYDVDGQYEGDFTTGEVQYYLKFAEDNTTAVSSSWASDANGWWIQNSDGSYLKDTWYQSPESGAWYYMGSDGYMLTNTTTPDGCVVNADGVWVQ